MSHLALKDLFSGFFVIDDEEEVEVPDKQQQVNESASKRAVTTNNKTKRNQISPSKICIKIYNNVRRKE